MGERKKTSDRYSFIQKKFINSHFYEIERQELIGYGQVGKRRRGSKALSSAFKFK